MPILCRSGLLALLVSLLSGGCVRSGFQAARVPGSDAAASEAGPDGAALDGGSKEAGGELDLIGLDQGHQVPGGWVMISSGSFSMGSPPGEPCRNLNNETQHQVTLTRDFAIQATEVTQGQFQSLLGSNPSSFKSCGSSCPVETVSWHQAVAYCNALSSLAGKDRCYTCSGSGASTSCQEASSYSGRKIYDCPGYRLPTEAEWEYASRAGTQTAFYNGANDPGQCSTCVTVDVRADQIAWYRANSTVGYPGCYPVSGCGCLGPHPVGSKAANAWGLFDTAGNVWEWCHDRFQEDLGTAATVDPSGPTLGATRVMRGCSWYNPAGGLRAAARDFEVPGFQDNSVGFRCVRTATPGP